MRMSRFVMVVAATCFAAGSLIEAQGRGHGPAGHAPQMARTGGGSPNTGAANSHVGKSGNAGDPTKNASGGGRGAAGEERGHGGTHPGDGGANEGAGHRNGGVGGENHGNAGGHGETDTDQDARGGRGRSGSDRGHDGSFVAHMNPQLRARLESMLPSGMTLEQAADGFRNQGQFIAALQQSQNHDISFADLKTQMTGDKPLSLGDAMRKLGVKSDED